MSLPDEMRTLVDQLREAHTARMNVVAGLRTEAIQGLEDQRTAHREMAATLERQLKEANEHRRSVTGSMLREIAGEIAGAHEVWVEFDRLMRQGRPGAPAAAPAARPMTIRPMPKKRGRPSRGRSAQ